MGSRLVFRGQPQRTGVVGAAGVVRVPRSCPVLHRPPHKAPCSRTGTRTSAAVYARIPCISPAAGRPADRKPAMNEFEPGPVPRPRSRRGTSPDIPVTGMGSPVTRATGLLKRRRLLRGGPSGFHEAAHRASSPPRPYYRPRDDRSSTTCSPSPYRPVRAATRGARHSPPGGDAWCTSLASHAAALDRNASDGRRRTGRGRPRRASATGHGPGRQVATQEAGPFPQARCGRPAP